jgi:hypothetical protein
MQHAATGRCLLALTPPFHIHLPAGIGTPRAIEGALLRGGGRASGESCPASLKMGAARVDGAPIPDKELPAHGVWMSRGAFTPEECRSAPRRSLPARYSNAPRARSRATRRPGRG